MTLIIADRVRETTTVVGTGSITLLGAVTGYQSFSTIGNGNTTYYACADQGGPNWEVGIGTWFTGGTLARTTVLASSNSGSLVNFTTGTKDVFVTYPSEEAVYNNGTSIVGPTGSSVAVANGGTGQTTFTAGQVLYGNGTSGLSTSANMTFDGSTLTTLNSAYTGTLTGGTGIVNLGSGQFYKDTSGNVGIGTSSPNFAGVSKAVTLNTTNGSSGAIYEIGINGTDYAYLFANASNTVLSSVQSLPLLFNTGNTERMRIDSSGNVGIGTGSPQSKFNVYGSAGTANITMSDSTLGVSYGGQVRGYGVGGAGGFAELGVLDNGTYTKGVLVSAQANYVSFYTGLTFGGSSERMRIDSSGNLLVNETTNANGGKVDINGRMSATGFSVPLTAGGATAFFGEYYYTGSFSMGTGATVNLWSSSSAYSAQFFDIFVQSDYGPRVTSWFQGNASGYGGTFTLLQANNGTPVVSFSITANGATGFIVSMTNTAGAATNIRIWVKIHNTNGTNFSSSYLTLN